MFIYINGEIVKQENAKISPFDHGYIYGLGVFETLRVYNGHPFLLDDHLSRLRSGLEELNIQLELTRTSVLDILHKTLLSNGLKDAYVRINISAGQGEIGLQTEEYLNPTIIVFVKPLPSFQKQKQAIILDTIRNTPEGPFRLKSHHFLNNIYAKRELGNDPNKEGIFLTKEGNVAEGITSNLFWVKDECFYTPSLSTGILSGITRAYLMDVIRLLGYPLVEGEFSVNEIERCDEIFITNSVQEIVPIFGLNEREFPGVSGPLTSKLMKIYQSHNDKLWSRDELREGMI